MQADAHKKAVSLFKSYAANGQDKELKSFASETLPALKQHLDHVKQLEASSQ
jgi:putative membrane protein